MRELVLASGNAGKPRELEQLLEGLPVRVRALGEFTAGEAEETGVTFIENALIKARHAAALTGLPALADDSGLEVDVLAGAPGVYSARYAGVNATDEANRVQLLQALSDLDAQAPEQRRARFRCVLALLRHPLDPAPLIAEGVWEGRVAASARGTRGFGYDPLFELPDRGCTAAELEPAEKGVLSHRGQALAALRPRLEAWLEASPPEPLDPA